MDYYEMVEAARCLVETAWDHDDEWLVARAETRGVRLLVENVATARIAAEAANAAASAAAPTHKVTLRLG